VSQLLSAVRLIRVIAILTAIALIASACGGGSPQTSSPAVAATATQSAQPTAVEKWPTSPITIVIPNSPGTTLDTQARAIQPILSRLLGVPVVVDNKPGGGSTVGIQEVWSKPPDGQSVFFFLEPDFTGARLALPTVLGVDDLAYIGAMFAPDEPALLVKPGGKYGTLNDVLQALKRGDRVTLGAPPGNAALYGLLATTDLLGLKRPEVIFYSDSAKQRLDLLGGQLDMITGNKSGYLSLHKDKQAVFIGFFSDARATDVPEVPTVREVVDQVQSGKGKDVPQITQQRLMVVPAKLKTQFPNRYATLTAAVKALVDDAEFKAWATKSNTAIRWVEPDQLAALSRVTEALIKKYPEARQ
jgi:tripartite-type tricarboxylate transporter receptor subunit TctC